MSSPYIIPEENIKNNKNWFIDIFKKVIIPRYTGADLLLKWIEGTDFFEAPASAKGHLSCKGGLCQHTLNVYNRMNQLAITGIIPPDLDSLGTDSAGIALVSLCHDLCKCNQYKEEFKNVKVYSDTGSRQDEGGRFDWQSQKGYKLEPDIVGFGHGGKSLWIVQNFVKNLPIDEALAIRHHMGGFEYPGQPISEPYTSGVYNDSNLALYLHICDMLSTFVDEKY